MPLLKPLGNGRIRTFIEFGVPCLRIRSSGQPPEARRPLKKDSGNQEFDTDNDAEQAETLGKPHKLDRKGIYIRRVRLNVANRDKRPIET